MFNNLDKRDQIVSAPFGRFLVVLVVAYCAGLAWAALRLLWFVEAL